MPTIPADAPYRNASLAVETRVADLLARMTLDEKFAQMRLNLNLDQVARGETPEKTTLQQAYPDGLGGTYIKSEISRETCNAIQRHFVESTRLGIPLLFMGESLHGCRYPGATVFPQAIGLGSTWNVELMEAMAAVIGRECREVGMRMTYAPNLDLSRDPRWGRVEENYGEDPYLTARLGVAYVKSLQSQGVAACPKHYVAHGSPESGINLSPVHAGERELRDTMLEPFAAAFQEGGAMGVMPAYSELDGIPVHASRFLMTTLLREEIGFEGISVSDFGAITMLHHSHRTAETPLEAGRQALWAGLDMEAPNVFGFGGELLEAVRRGAVPLAWVDQAVARVLRVKFMLGLFETPYLDADTPYDLNRPDEIALARRAGQESVVLLKNEGSLLPLPTTLKRVALVGPNAAIAQLGDYTSPEALNRAVPLKQALEARLGADRVAYAPGGSIAFASDAQIDAAVAAARSADAVIAVLGDNSCFFGGVGWGDKGDDGKSTVTCGEGFDMAELKLPGRQQDLLEAVAATGKPLVLVLMTGRPYAITWADEHVPAILQAWYPGEQGGHALCDLIFGDANPSGRLPISFPRSAGHIPCFYNHKVLARGRYYRKPGTPEAPGRDYVFDTPEPLYPFGHGLSYTTFAYRDLAATPGRVAADGRVEVAVTVENTGAREGAEVVQLYLTDCFSRITPFVKRLRGFRKLTLKPGEHRRVRFSLDARDFAFINEQMKPEVEPGTFQVAIGDRQVEFEIVARD
ncbi:MAG: hypothetical protein GX590_06490 [Lentisphaerae bacterium]|nr:hypothetical protein [Lentisphaerota bacterium]